MKQLIREHCLSIPHSQSHYSLGKSSRLYFENSELTLTKLYLLFVEYYTNKIGKAPPITQKSYCNYFNKNLNFSFSKPKTDVCNLCFEFKIVDDINEDFYCHKQSVEEYKLLKNTILSEKNLLCMEFDFGQNLALPKLPVTEQFYKRLIWLHIFNANVFGRHKRSYMYSF